MAASWETMSNAEWVLHNMTDVAEDNDYAGYSQYLEELEEQYEVDSELARMAEFYRHEWQADEDYING